MRMLLTPYIQNDLGIVVLKPGRELLPNFRFTPRILITNEPEHLKESVSGALPEASQELALNEDLKPFLTDLSVIGAAGGKDALISSVRRKKCCQWHDKSDCHKETTLYFCDGWPVKFCWHHDNKFRNHINPSIDEIANKNIVEWVLGRICSDLKMPEGHQLTVPEVCWWSVVKQVAHKLPESIVRQSLNLPQASIPAGEMKEADIKPYDDSALPIIQERVNSAHESWIVLDKPVVKVVGDEAPPQSFMLKPKLKRWECEKYTKWVKTQSCRCCGNQADDPHHLIGHGLGVMGSKNS